MKKTFRLYCALSLLLTTSLPASVVAAGNYPEAGSCKKDKPYYAICTHSLHSLEGWYSRECFATEAEAQKAAEEHAKEFHNGNMRWTGVHKSR